jgi:hypothetical protein
MARDPNGPRHASDRFRQEGDRRFLYLAIFTLVFIGGGLIALIFGGDAFLAALPCLLGGALLILLPWFALSLLQKWRDRIG